MIHVLRHGESEYRQAIVPIQEARDLTMRGYRMVRESARELCAFAEPDEQIAIWTSPYARCVASAATVGEEFLARGIPLRHARSGPMFRVTRKLSEVRNFSWPLFLTLVQGGQHEIDGWRIDVDPKDTNPHGLSAEEYYAVDAIEQIPYDTMYGYPGVFAHAVLAIELFREATARMLGLLARLRSLGERAPHRLILVTHDGLAAFLAETATANAIHTVERGRYITLERAGDGFVVTHVHGQGSVRSEDVFDAFTRRFIGG